MKNETLDFLTKPNPITNIKQTKEYDVVVVGAGSPGVPCAIAANEAVAKSLCCKKSLMQPLVAMLVQA